MPYNYKLQPIEVSYPIGEGVLPPLVEDDEELGKVDGVDRPVVFLSHLSLLIMFLLSLAQESVEFVFLRVVAEDPEGVAQVAILDLAVAAQVEEVKSLVN